MSAHKVRIALYSCGMVGLGHFRRNCIIADTLARSSLKSENLLIAEAREATAFGSDIPGCIDMLTLPALSKNRQGECKPRYLDLPLADLVRLRGRAIQAALQAFQPDVLIVDYLPRGACRELD